MNRNPVLRSADIAQQAYLESREVLRRYLGLFLNHQTPLVEALCPPLKAQLPIIH